MTPIEFNPAQSPGHVIQVSLSETVNLALVWCPAGEFLMGVPDSVEMPTSVEKPQHKVILTRGFWIGQIPLTQEQWLMVMGWEPNTLTGLQLPALGMTWQEAEEFCTRLTTHFQSHHMLAENHKFDLPTEAQWEYACRAGTETRWYFGDDPEPFSDHAWFKDNCNDSLHPVGLKKPNPWRLHDCYGSAYEWCINNLYRYQPSAVAIVDSAYNKTDSDFYAVRGGSIFSSPIQCQSAYRRSTGANNPFNDPTGVRVVCIETDEK